MSKKSAAVGTGAIALSPLVDMVLMVYSNSRLGRSVAGVPLRRERGCDEKNLNQLAIGGLPYIFLRSWEILSHWSVTGCRLGSLTKSHRVKWYKTADLRLAHHCI